ncbi:Arl10 [Symbiodinium microadriaticum]|nr:Arl10 [Symbiodinium microadriaticum]
MEAVRRAAAQICRRPTAGVVKAYCDGINTSSIAKGKGEEVPLKTAVTLREPIALSPQMQLLDNGRHPKGIAFERVEGREDQARYGELVKVEFDLESIPSTRLELGSAELEDLDLGQGPRRQERSSPPVGPSYLLTGDAARVKTVEAALHDDNWQYNWINAQFRGGKQRCYAPTGSRMASEDEADLRDSLKHVAKTPTPGTLYALNLDVFFGLEGVLFLPYGLGRGGGQTDLDAARALLVQLVSSLPRLPFFVQQCSHFMRTVWNKAQCWTKKLTAPSVFKWGTLPDWEPHRGAVSLVTFNPGPFLCWELAGPWGPPDFHPCCGPRLPGIYGLAGFMVCCVWPCRAWMTREPRRALMGTRQVLLLGLDGVGKSAFLWLCENRHSQRLPAERLVPTMGVQKLTRAEVPCKQGFVNLDFTEIGGNMRLREYWQHYLRPSLSLVVFFVDARVEDALDALGRLAGSLRRMAPEASLVIVSVKSNVEVLRVSIAALRARYPELPEARLATSGLHLEDGARPHANALLQEIADIVTAGAAMHAFRACAVLSQGLAWILWGEMYAIQTTPCCNASTSRLSTSATFAVMEASTLQARVLEKLQATGQPAARGSASSRLPTQTVSNRRRQVSESSSSEDGFGYSSSDSESDKELRLDVRSTQVDLLKASRICSRRDLTNCLRKRRRLLQISLAALIVTALSFVAFAAYELEQTEQLGGSLQQAAPRWRTDDLPQQAWLAAGWGLPPVMRESRPGDGLRSNNSYHAAEIKA